MSDALIVTSRVDPRDLRINLRYRSNATMPEAVRYARGLLASDVADKVEATGWQPPKLCRVHIYFSFPDRRSDLDGPIKHTLDALQDGIRAAIYGSKWNDRQVESLSIDRVIGEPRITIIVHPMKLEKPCRSS